MERSQVASGDEEIPPLQYSVDFLEEQVRISKVFYNIGSVNHIEALIWEGELAIQVGLDCLDAPPARIYHLLFQDINPPDIFSPNPRGYLRRSFPMPAPAIKEFSFRVRLTEVKGDFPCLNRMGLVEQMSKNFLQHQIFGFTTLRIWPCPWSQDG